MTERRVFIAEDGVALVADIAGPRHAPAVILCHGGGQTRHSWSRAFNHLVKAGYRVTNFDARGHGESDWSADNRYPMSRRWADLKLITAAYEHSSVAIVGASMGGSTALYGMSCGYRPGALVLVDITPNAEAKGMRRVRDFMASGLQGFASISEAAEAVSAYNANRPRPADTSGLKRNLRQRADGRWYWHWDPGMLNIDIDHERAQMLGTIDSLKASRDVPILLVRGLKSDVVPDRVVEDFRERLPHINIANVGNAGHMVAGDENDAFNDAVFDFLSKHIPPLSQ